MPQKETKLERRQRFERQALGYMIKTQDPDVIKRVRSLEFLYEPHEWIRRIVIDRIVEGKDLNPTELVRSLRRRVPYTAETLGLTFDAAQDMDADDFDAAMEFFVRRPGETDLNMAPESLRLADYATPDPFDLRKEVIRGLPQGTISFLHGPEGTGKTALALQLAIAKATGTPWVGKPTGAAGPVYFLAQETPLSEVQARVKAIARRDGHDLSEIASRLGITSESELQGSYLDFDAHAEALERTIRNMRAELVIIDHLSALSSDERDTGQIEIVEGLKAIAVRTSSAILIIDHDNKAGEGERRAQAGRGQKRRPIALSLWLRPDNQTPGMVWMSGGKGRNLPPEEIAGRTGLLWESLADPWDRESLGKPVTWGYLDLGSHQAAATNRPAIRNPRSEGLEAILTTEWIETRAIVDEAVRQGIVKSSSAGRTVRRELERLEAIGHAERQASRGPKPARWRRTEITRTPDQVKGDPDNLSGQPNVRVKPLEENTLDLFERGPASSRTSEG